jgi:hypothetical protein
MKIQDIRQGVGTIIELKGRRKRDGALPIRIGTPIRLIRDQSGVLLSMLEGIGTVEAAPADASNKDTLHRLLTRNLPSLSVILDVEDCGRIVVSTRTFKDEIPMDISIGIEDQFMNKARKQLDFKDVRKPEETLDEQFILRLNGLQYAVLGIHIEAGKKDRLSDFLFAGKDGYLHIQRREDEAGNLLFYADRVVNRIDETRYSFTLVKGAIKFQNTTSLEKARLVTVAAMNELGGSIEGYLTTWEKYGQIEEKFIYEQARRAGAVPYESWEPAERGWIRLHVDGGKQLDMFAREIKNGTAVTMTEGDPSSMLGSNFDVEWYKEFLSNEEKQSNASVTRDIQVEEERIYVKLADDTVPPKSGFVFMSLYGDMERFRRRSEARDRILNGTNQMPQLAAILEGKSASQPREQRFEPISPSVKAEIFPKNDPTPMQKKAIELAINTPDIAIIQGPPGTGKTTVIRAILKRLNEIGDSSDSLFGRNLVSAYQHDAVENAVERIDILGMPAIKIGSRSNSLNDNPQIIELRVENWIDERLQKLYERYPEVVKNDALARFDDMYNNYLYSSNSVDNTLRLLEAIRELLLEKLSPELMIKLQRIVSELRMTTDRREPSREYLLRSIRSLPTTRKAYSDNGKQTLMEAVYRLKQEGLPQLANDIEALERIHRKKEREDVDFEQLRSIRKHLLSSLIPEENIFHTPKQKNEILELLRRISDHLRAEYHKTSMSEEAVLRDYIAEYSNSPLAIRNAMMEYMSVLGVTNQQVAGRKATMLKGENGYYENVLVDEAARSNPLDLFIPMSLARDRIILVGDHRQLPHIVDEKIIDEIEKETGAEGDAAVIDKVKENIKNSLFQHLFRELKKLENKDNIQRTVTLDMQYRTHRVLGDFVSANFYEKHGEVYIESPLPESMFAHDLPGLENKACVWYDVPLRAGAEHSGQSKSRPAEAVAIARHLKNMMDSDAARGLNFGIIAFYREQVKTIYEELVKVGVAVRVEGEEEHYEIVEKYRDDFVNGKKVEKLRIGTVDAFQGMEFDVVYLSMVRSNSLPDRTSKEKQRKYGHLMVENRLCVSMSRQKRMLIVVGDSGMLKGPEAEKSIPALVNYYSLCRGEQQYGHIFV